MTSSDLQSTESTVRTWHRVLETFKFAYAKRTDLADEKYVNVTAVSLLVPKATTANATVTAVLVALIALMIIMTCHLPMTKTTLIMVVIVI